MLALAAVTRLHLSKQQQHAHTRPGAGAPWDILDAKQLNGCAEEVVVLKDTSGVNHNLRVTMVSGDKADVFIEEQQGKTTISSISASEDGKISAEVKLDKEVVR